MAQTMNDNDRIRLDALEAKIDMIDANVRRLHNAILGDHDAGSIGLVARIIKLETGRADTYKRIEDLEDTKKNVYAYAAAISFLISAISGIIFTVVRFMRM
jgi:hypothetical protein